KNCCDIGYCTREKLNVPRGERYELCRSVHAEANSIIHADRQKMLGATMYLVGKEFSNGEYVPNTNSCAMCKRLIINSGIDTVVIRDDKTNFRVIDVYNEWVLGDESLDLVKGY
ncbi:MAG: cytidine deaminase, partial [Oscillospiraceae bacterium]